ncbi:MAG: hypothetical protein CMR00_12745 [[Chlorobium] sp. 445]|nr:MAG: hypothetical protein CMR00_12745 [[Chlorobium] sp. 445]
MITLKEYHDIRHLFVNVLLVEETKKIILRRVFAGGNGTLLPFVYLKYSLFAQPKINRKSYRYNGEYIV